MICVRLKQKCDADITYSVSDISYMTLAQLSQYMRVDNIKTKADGLLIPPTIHMDGEAFYAFMKSIDLAKKTAKRLINAYDIPDSEAAYVIPQACPVSADITVNPSILSRDLFGNASWEIRDIISMMKEIANGREN